MKHPKIRGGFVLVPKDTMKCEKYKLLKSPTKVVYSVMLTEFVRDKGRNPDNKVKIPHTQMEENAHVGHSSVVRAIKELKEQGFIRVLEPGGLEGNPTIFQLNGRYTHSGNTESSW